VISHVVGGRGMKRRPNDPRSCGSGRKYKKCCEGKATPSGLPPDLSRLFAEAQRGYQQGQLERAEQVCREILASDPQDSDAVHQLGAAAIRAGRLEQATELIRSAIALDPASAIYHGDLGAVLNLMGRMHEAVAEYRRALELKPDFVDALSNLGGILLDLKKPEEARSCLERAVALNPAHANAHLNSGSCYLTLDRPHDAARHFWKALQLQPDSLQAANDLGACLARGGFQADAIPLYQKAAELHPNNPAVWVNLGAALKDLGEPGSGLVHLERALALEPEHATARWNRSLCLLSLGRLAEGWADYDWRLLGGAKQQPRPFSVPLWDGSDPAGKTVLVWMEQGLGDHILFSSMLPDLLSAGARCIVECDWRLVSLLQRSFRGIEAVPMGDPPRPRTLQPDIDFQIAAGSLPRWCRQSLKRFPNHRGFLVPDPLRVTHWKERVERLGDGLKVGICWRSMVNQEDRAVMYSKLNQWGPILTTRGIQFVSLQYDECAEELGEAERFFDMRVKVWEDMDLKNDQEGVAALISSLDLVLSAGTAVDQMAGALGKSAWVVGRGEADLWGLGTNYCPWYPSIRSFLSRLSDPWEPMLEKVASELASLVAAGSIPHRPPPMI
jgi:tetratricopeptide (TPR) repeat protein